MLQLLAEVDPDLVLARGLVQANHCKRLKLPYPKACTHPATSLHTIPPSVNDRRGIHKAVPSGIQASAKPTKATDMQEMSQFCGSIQPTEP
jgi:hypothetical protein